MKEVIRAPLSNYYGRVECYAEDDGTFSLALEDWDGVHCVKVDAYFYKAFRRQFKSHPLNAPDRK